MANSQSAAIRQHIAGNIAGVIVARGTGTTHASANTTNPVTHGAVDHNGNAYPAANLQVMAFETTNEAFVFEGAAISATTFDVQSAGTAVPYKWILVLFN